MMIKAELLTALWTLLQVSGHNSVEWPVQQLSEGCLETAAELIVLCHIRKDGP